ncbi:MAG: FAD-dependent oxidoreductase [Bacteroidia bacterium]|jgi:NAD(P)H-nitrite reductase large subunit|nr:FAD-dependent oxidoreductase [Bacteroidia bacterium]
MNEPSASQPLVIIGNGIAGITCARHVRKRSPRPVVVISAETDHFFSRTALMYIYMGHMKYEHTKPYEDWFWVKNNITLVRKYVVRIDTEKRELHFDDETRMMYGDLVLATGSKSNFFGWPGQDLKGVQGLYSYPDLQRMEADTQGISRAVVVGGGLIGVEMVEMLHSRGIHVTFLVRESEFWRNVLPAEEAALISRHLREHGIDLRLNTELKELLPDAQGRVRAVVTSQGEEIACQFAGITVGVSPNTEMARQSGIACERGILVNEFFETEVPHVYAIGDCAQYRTPPPGRRAIEPLWYTGRFHGETLALTLTGKRTAYQPGPWFNSAKFFDIEYQTYGDVKANAAENEKAFYWEHAGGKMSFRAVFDAASQKLIGINVFGIRLRHEMFDQWLREGRTVSHAIEHLADANFDPEFYRTFEHEIARAFHTQTGITITPRPKSLLRIFKRPQYS